MGAAMNGKPTLIWFDDGEDWARPEQHDLSVTEDPTRAVVGTIFGPDGQVLRTVTKPIGYRPA